MNEHVPTPYTPTDLISNRAANADNVSTVMSRLLDRVTKLEQDAQVMVNDTDSQEQRLVKQDERIFVLEMEIEQLKSGNPTAKRADQIEKDVLDFMKAHPGMRLTPGIIYLNMPAERGYKSHNINNKLYTLANNGAIERLKDTGKVTVYWYKEEKI
jgi:hypothetical protein